MVGVDEETVMLPPLSLGDGLRPLVFAVTDLRQWHYCPRIVYFRYNWPPVRPQPYVLEEGKEAHQELWLRIARRQRLRGIPEGEYQFEVAWVSERWGLSGKSDLVVLRDEEVIPVDFKDSRHLQAPHFRVQLAAYGLLVEERFRRRATRGFLYSIPRRVAVEVKLTAQLRRRVVETVREMEVAVQGEGMPKGPLTRARCVACEFRRFCNDRV
ncbi:MAG: CRISPR-associated protein Cas4 [Armatimonadota bacterium]